MKIIIDVPEKLVVDGFERPFTEEERNILIKIITEYYNDENKSFGTETDRIIISKQLVKEAIDYFMKHEPDRFRLLQHEANERVKKENGGE